MDQPLEFPYEAPTPPHEELPATSPQQEIQLDDVLERIGRLSINDEAPPSDQPGPSRKIPKWATKTLESVHLDEVGKMGTRSSKRHDDGGEAYNSGDDMMYHLIVNLIYLLTLNQLPLKKLLLELSGKKLCK